MPRSFWLAIVVGLIGAIFTLQGIGVLGGSAMSGSNFWAIVGAILVIVAVVIGWRSVRTAPR